MKKRILAALLTLCMSMSLLPANALAADWEGLGWTPSGKPETDEWQEVSPMEEPVQDFGADQWGTSSEPYKDVDSSWGIAAFYGGTEYVLRDGNLYSNDILMEAGEITWLILRDDALYWSAVAGDETDIWRMNLNYGRKTAYYHVFAPVESFDVAGDDLYYLCNGEVVRANVLTDEETSLLVDRSFKAFFLDSERNIRAIDIEQTISVEDDVDDGFYEYDEVYADDDESAQLFASSSISSGWLWPAKDSKTIGSPYNIGYPALQSKRPAGAKEHRGIDIPINRCYVYASKGGTVKEVFNGCGHWTEPEDCKKSKHSNQGNHIVITHNDGTKSVYMHLLQNSILVKEGEMVSQGQPLATSGSSGQSFGPHLHFAIRDQKNNYINVNPKTSTVIKSKNTNTYSNKEICTGGTIEYICDDSLYLPVSDPPPPPTDRKMTFSISSTQYPTGSIKRAAFRLGGTVTSKYPFGSITGTLYDVTAGRVAQQYTVYPSKTSYKISGNALDNNLKFQNLISGHTYYLKYEAKDIYGPSPNKDKPWTWTSEQFSVYENAPNTSVTPSIAATIIAAGQKVSIKCTDDSAEIHYRVNGGSEKTGHTLLEESFTAAGTYDITAWTTRSGYTKSSEAYKSINVSRASTPQISNAVFTERNAYVTISGPGTIRYTIDGTAPNDRSPQYTGPIYLTSDCTVRAIAVEYGKQNSLAASKYLQFSIPSAPASVSLYNTANKIAAGKTATVCWQAVPTATAYDAVLYRDGICVSELKDIPATKAVFTLNEPGVYYACVKAKNFLGSSAESAPVTIEAMAPVTVTVVDRIVRSGSVTDMTVTEIRQRINNHDRENALNIEGNVISTQTVDYGGLAVRPNTPSKAGFTFAGYSMGWSTPVTEDTTVYADYEVNYYTVEFWNDYDINGIHYTEQIGPTQEVMYTASAVAPQDFYIPVGYTLAGWSVDNSVSDCFDHTYVEGNMRLYTSYAWANEDLPTVVQISSVSRDDKCTSYLVNLTYFNNNLEDTQARLIVSLYSDSGRMVYTQTKDIDLDRFMMGTSLADSIRLNYVHKISKVTAVLVQVKDDLTGGAISEMASTTDIKFPDSGGYWGAWSGWDENPVFESDTRQIETKTQYHYRDMQFTTSSSSSLAGWTKYNTTSTTGPWKTSTTAVSEFTTDAQKRQVNKLYIAPTYKTQYHYYRFYKVNSAPWTDYDVSHPYCEEYWADKQLPKLRYSGGMNQYGDGYTGNAKSKYWLICDGSKYGGADAVKRGLISDASWTRQVKTGGGYYQYEYRDIFYTYYFRKWGAWSPWSDTQYSSSANRDVQDHTVYRYRDYCLNYPGYDPGNDSSLEEETVAAFEIFGNISELANDYCGKKATVLVYKKTNADPTQEQLEYVDQITLGVGNSYSFIVNPKEAIDYQKTGDFIVTLSIEGCGRLVNIDVIKAQRPTYTVTFYTEDGVVFAEREVLAGGGVDVNELSMPVKEGHRFVKWDKSVVNVSRNLEVTAVFEKISYPVIFVDHENQTTMVEEIPYGEPIASQVPESVEGKTFDHWEGLIAEEGEFVRGSMVLTAVWIPHTYTVEFRDFDGTTVGDPQTVSYGASAKPPAPVVKDGVAYPWNVTGAAWWNVTQDMAIYPYIPQVYSVSAPTASIPTGNAYGLFSVELLSESDNSAVYYTVDEPLTEEDAIAYAGMLAAGTESYAEAPSLFAGEEQSEGDSEYTEYDEGIDEPTDFICAYTAPISVYAGSTVYAFAVDESGAVSTVAAFYYEMGADPEDDSDETGSNSIRNVSFDAASGVVSADIAHDSQAKVIAAAYDYNKKMVAVAVTNLAIGEDTVSLQLKITNLGEAVTVKVFLLDSVSEVPLCPEKSIPVSA